MMKRVFEQSERVACVIADEYQEYYQWVYRVYRGTRERVIPIQELARKEDQ